MSNRPSPEDSRGSSLASERISQLIASGEALWVSKFIKDLPKGGRFSLKAGVIKGYKAEIDDGGRVSVSLGDQISCAGGAYSIIKIGSANGIVVDDKMSTAPERKFVFIAKISDPSNVTALLLS